MKPVLAIAALALLSSAAFADKHYVVIGQSNAYRLAVYGKLEAALGLGSHVINCSHSGQPIEKFLPSWDVGSFFGDCLSKMSGKDIAGIVFWQGEQNTLDESYATWGDKARTVIVELRKEIGRNVPLVIFALNDLPHPANPYWDDVRVQQMRMVPMNSKKIDSRRYPFADTVHLAATDYPLVANDVAKLLKVMK